MLPKNKARLSVILIMTLFLGMTIFQSNHFYNVFANLREERIVPKTNILPKISPINDSFLERPILDVEKDVNTTIVNPEKNEWIKVNITITNISNFTAYNLTLVDPYFGDWASSNLNVTEQNWVIIEKNASIYYFYFLKPLLEGNFTLEPTDIVYYDINGTEYHAQSQRFIITAIKLENIAIIDAELWLNILYYSLIIIGILGAIVLFDLFVIKRPKQIKKRKEKIVEKKGTATQKSKKQLKRKTQKRR